MELSRRSRKIPLSPSMRDTLLIECFSRSNMLEEMVMLLDAIDVQAGRMDDAMDIKTKMEEAGFNLDIIGHISMIGGFCRKKKIEDASELLRKMEIAGFKPDLVTYNTLLSYFCDKGDFEHARRVMKK